MGILFVAGAALLNQVTFSTSTLEAARQTRQTNAAVDAIEDMALGWLADGFIGPDGLALNPESRLVAHEAGNPNAACTNGMSTAPDCVVSLPAYSEVPGIQPWLDVSDPTEYDLTGFGSQLRYKLHSDPVLALERRSGVAAKRGLSLSPPENPSTWKVDPAAWASSTDVDEIDGPNLPRDADGDGIIDSFQFRLPEGVLPAELQRDLADRLRDDANYRNSDPNRDPDDLWVSLRIVPHGAMLDLNGARESMIRWLLANINIIKPIESYSPQTNEWYLRHRGLMLPRSLPRTPLLQYYATELLRPQEWPQGGGASVMTILTDPSAREWWGYDFMTDASGIGSPWTELVRDPLQTGVYDLIHNVTTINYDDQLMRPGRYPFTGEDWIQAMRRAEGDPAGTQKYASSPTFAIDNYPEKLDGLADPRLGRLKLSLPELDEIIDAAGYSDLNDLAISTTAVRQRIIRTIQETFLLMLHEHGKLQGTERALTAAMLTANLIDFADSDVGNEPTNVEVIDFDMSGSTPGIMTVPGSDGSTPLTVYGYERQPFITELYASATRDAIAPPSTPGGDVADSSQSGFAIELYNPYSSAINLDGYRLKELSSSTPLDIGVAGLAQAPDPLDEDLMNQSIPANGFLTVFSMVDPMPTGSKVGSTDKWVIHEESKIALVRSVTNGPDIIVDLFDVENDIASGAPAQLLKNSSPDVRSWERDNGRWPSTTNSRWRFVVPRAQETVNSGHTLGDFNTYDDPAIFPVHLDVVSGLRSFEQAYRTTGTLFLLSRMAHVYDGSSGTQVKWTAPFNRTNVAGEPPLLPPTETIAGNFASRDNGRIPVFDLGNNPSATPNPLPKYRDASNYKTRGTVEGIQALPWGQLIYDYFTALPLKACDSTAYNCDRDRLWPYVDQEGLRVRGRININAAPWIVMASAPTSKVKYFPTSYHTDLLASLAQIGVLNDDMNSPIREDIAKSISWYREAMDASALQGARDFESARDPYDNFSPPDPTYAPRQGYGFLTVGELFNVRGTDTVRGDKFGMDAGALRFGADVPEGSYERAVGRMVALGDWFTTRSHVFTVYGVIRGQFDDNGNAGLLEESLRATDQRAIRFQTTVDRLPMFFGRSRPERIGARVDGGYADVRDD